jgi:regulatory protein
VAGEAYQLGVKLLARRELSEAQLRHRLVRKQCPVADIDGAVERLRREGVLDDQRTALVCARSEAIVKHHGRLRALRRIELLGIPPTIARSAVEQVFADVDEDALIARAVERRLGRMDASDQGAFQRVYQHLLRQGFDPDRVQTLLRQYQRQIPRTHEDA